MTNERGISLIENLVALLILTAGVLGCSLMLVTAYGLSGTGGEDTTALTLAQEKLESLRNEDFASSALMAGTTTETLGGSFVGYTRETTIQDDTPIQNLKQIEVTVTGPNGRVAELTSLLADV